MKQFFLVEMYITPTALGTGGDFRSAMVKAKSFSEAAALMVKLHGESDVKLLGIYEQSEIDKTVFNRVK